MPNIKFNYLYRCSGNYKKFGSVIFSNPAGIKLLEVEVLIKPKLIDETWFYADQWRLPEIFTDIVNFRVDPTWHEFESVEDCVSPVNIILTLTDFITLISNT